MLAGPDAVPAAAAWPCDVVLNGVTGAVGLTATIAALDAGRTLALANKESLITGGWLVTKRAAPTRSSRSTPSTPRSRSACAGAPRRKSAGSCAHRQAEARSAAGAGTASATVTPEQALAHPTWNMGPSNTLNSATLVNKGLELIEAHLLLGVGLDRIAVVVHPQSIVHSIVEYTDGATIAMASPPDMRLPIALAMAWPTGSRTQRPRWTGRRRPPGPSSRSTRRRSRLCGWLVRRPPPGGAAQAIYNAANEECLDAFITERSLYRDRRHGVTGHVAT